MKKLFAIVLTVAMVLGLATTAFAAWGPSATANDPEKFPTVEVIKYVKHTAAGGSFYYTVEPNAQAINDAKVYYAVKVVVPALSDALDDGLIKVEVKVEGLRGAIAVAKDTACPVAEGTYYLTGANAFTASSGLALRDYIIEADCADTDTAKVTATVSAKDAFKAGTDAVNYATDAAEAARATDGANLTKGIWTVEKISSTAVDVYKSATGAYVQFTRDSQTGLVTGVKYFDQFEVFEDTNTANQTQDAAEPTTQKSAKVVLNSDATKGFTLNANGGATMGNTDEDFVKDALAFVGFTMADVVAKNIYMTDANCIANFGTNLKATSTAAWGAAKDPIILDAVTVIPKTGDVVTIGAAIMTLVAAAGALSLRKH